MEVDVMDKLMKLQNILFPKEDLTEHWWLFYRGSRLSHETMESAYSLKKSEHSEFFTYFNAFSLEKWKKYTQVRNVYLRLSIKGKAGIQLFGHYTANNNVNKEIISENYFEADGRETVMIPIPMDVKSQVVSFQLFAFDDLYLYEGSYIADMDASLLNEVDISLVTVTFQKEDFITRNLTLLENEILYTDEEVADHIFIRVIDNGRTLNAEEWNCDRIHIYPNPNVGGAGGYTRGMIETIQDQDFHATHALLMDDDVKILPESIIRTYNLLRCLRPEYTDHFVSGAMLYYERMHVQHEDVGFVSREGAFGARKPVMEMHLADSVVRNEKIYEDQPNNYAGWWYCCIPRTKLSLDRLALPLFIRGDDVEFSIANHAKFLTMNGICIWHMGFAVKFNMPMEFYQVHRNSLIIQAASGVTPEVDYAARISERFFIELNRFNYIGCDLLLDAIEDYLKGPEFLTAPGGEELMKKQASRVRKLSDARQTAPGLPIEYDKIYRRGNKLRGLKKIWYKITYNGHLLPAFLLQKKPAVIAYDWFDAPEKQYMREAVLAVNPYDETGILRYRSRKEFLRLIRRHGSLMRRYGRNKDSVSKQYKDAKQKLTGLEFWQEYLGLSDTER